MARVCTKRGVVLTAAVVAAVSGIAGGARADEVRVVAKVGDMVPGGNGQTVRLNRFTGFTNASNPLVGNSGHVLYTAEVTGTGVITANNRGLWRADSNGSAALVARIGSGVWAPSSSYYFTSVSAPMINADGMCAFQASLAGTGVTTANSQSYWCSEGATPALLVRGGESAVGIDSSIDLGTFSEPSWIRSRSGVGLLMFKSALSGTGVTTANNRALCADGIGANNAVVLARAGVAIDELPTLTCKEPYRATNSAGESVLYATLMGTGIITASATGAPVIPNDQVIWAPNASSPIARAGAVAPGAATGLRFSSLFSASVIRKPQLNARGSVAFNPTLCDSSGVAVGAGIWNYRSGSLRAVVATGDAAPGLGAGVTISSPIAPVTSVGYQLCDNDAVVFVSLLQGPGVSYESDRAIFRVNSDGTKQLLVRGGQAAPGLPAGVIITNDSIGRCWRVNASGEVAFVASLSGPGVTASDDVAIFSTVGGALRMVAREGQIVPDSNGWRLWSMLTEPAMYFNSLGQILFSAQADGGPNGTGGTGGWFRVDQNGELRAMVLGTEIVPNQTGANVRFNSVSTYAIMSFSDVGELALVSTLMPGGDFVGEAIVKIRITPAAAAVPNGACCTGTTCSVVDQQGCTGSFNGVSTTCGFTGNPVTCCPANFNRGGGVDVQDLFDFLAAFFANESAADYNRSGIISVDDVFGFLQDFFAGCPG